MRKVALSAILGASVAIGAVALAQTQSTQSQSTSQSGSGRASASASSSSSASSGGSAQAGGSRSAFGQGFGSQGGSTFSASATHAIVFSGSRDQQDVRVQKEQADYYRALSRDGKVLMVGPWRDKTGGLAILSVATDEEAVRIGQNDPMVRSGAWKPVVRGWDVSLVASLGQAVPAARTVRSAGSPPPR